MPNVFTLSGTSLDAQNNPAYVGRYMVLRITSVGTDTADAASYPQDSVSFLIDENGDWTSGATLWVNGDSGILSYYKMLEPSGQRLEFVFPSAVEGTTVRYEYAIENYLAEDAAAQVTPALAAHIADTSNPHSVTPAQLSLDTTDDVTFNSLTLTTDLALTEGGTGASNASDARDNLGLTIGTDVQAYDATIVVDADIGSTVQAYSANLDSVDQDLATTDDVTFNSLTLTTDLPLTEGGTGASTASAARTNLGVEIGVDVQAYNSVLDTTTASYTTAEETKLAGIEALAEVNDPTTLLDADIGSTVQAHDAVLDATTASFTTADKAKLDSIEGASTTSVVATTYTTLSTDNTILANNASGITITLLAAATAGDGFKLTIKNVGSSGSITIDGDGTETIDGGLTAILTTQYESITIVSDGSNWHII